MRRTLSKLVLLMVGSLIALVIGEIGLRFVVELPGTKPLPQVRYEPHPVRRFTLLPGQSGFTWQARCQVDGSGFRSNGPDSPAGSDRLILALGDSFTFGMGVEDHETWPAVLERRLSHDAQETVRVLNAGTVSYGVFQELHQFRERGLGLDPDVVIHGLYWNDYMSAGPPDPGSAAVVNEAGYFTWDDPRPPGGALRRIASRLTNRSALLFTLKRAVGKVRDDGGGTTAYQAAYSRFVEGELDPAAIDILQRFYEELAELSREHVFRLYVVIFPVVDLAGRSGSGDHPFPVQVRRLLDRLGIAYVDGFRLWEGSDGREPTFLPYNRHLNPRGYERVALELSALLMAESPE